MLMLSARARSARVALLEVSHQTMPALLAARPGRNLSSCVADGRSSREAIEYSIPLPQKRSNQIGKMDTWRVTDSRKRAVGGMWLVRRPQRVTTVYAGVQARLLAAEK